MLPPRPEVMSGWSRFAGPVEPGGWVEVQLQARAWVETVLSRISAGSLLVIDYGDTAEDLAPRRRDGTLRTYRSHHLGPHPLDEPGATDITADVNFSALVACGCRRWRRRRAQPTGRLPDGVGPSRATLATIGAGNWN